MLKKGKTAFALLCILCLLATAAVGSESSLRDIRTTIGRIEQGSFAMIGEMRIIPEECSGFEMLVSPDLPDGYAEGIIPGLPAPEKDESTGMLCYSLEEETTRTIMDNAYCASISPDGAFLWFIYTSRPFMAVQRGKTLLLMAQSSSRGLPDEDGSLESILEYKAKASSDPVEGEAIWSPDGRYLFFNDTERWRGERMMLNDPYILDTLTGDIFLIDSGGSPKDPLQGTFRCVLNGCFSTDGKSFYWYCRSYAPGVPAEHSLMRYDLETGAQEKVCGMDGPLLDLCEIRVNRWLLLEDVGGSIRLVRMTLSPGGFEHTEEMLPAFCASAGFLPAVREKVMIAVTPNPAGGTYLLPLDWNTPAGSASWRKIGSLSEDGLQKISADEIEAELREAKNSKSVLSGSANIGTAYIKHAAAINGVTDLLLTIYIREPVPDSWGGGYDDFSGQVILNTETLKLYTIRTGGVLDGFRDLFINGECFLMKNYGQEAVGLFSAYNLPEMSFVMGERYFTPYGTFMCRNESDPLVLSSVTLENHECIADIGAAEDGYQVRFHITDWPEPETIRQEFVIPEMLTGNRWTEVTSAMNKKDQKKLSSLYAKSVPDKLAERENRDEILVSYPLAATETLYILKDGLNTSALKSAEDVLAAAGYTAEDYRNDMAQVAVPRGTNVVTTKNGSSKTAPVRYSFAVSASEAYAESDRILALAGLCEQIGSAVMANRLSAAPLPLESVILEKYDLGSVDFYVMIDQEEQIGNTLEFSLTVRP